MSTLPVNTLYPSSKFFLFITPGSGNKLIIMCLVSKTGTVTSELSCNHKVPLISWKALELSVFCVEVSTDLLQIRRGDVLFKQLTNIFK
jgi:hypothetical protein